ncbi:hypothetical protein M422DRAFT_247728 [Sphaerobolus stellatus SS14]|nr:hypothetical protein M422DRAFT_247728 [Sphaerobolus stellatus SS14]
MNRMSPWMKELFIGPVTKSSGKTREPGNNWAHDKAAAKAAIEQIMAQTTIVVPVPGKGTDDCVRLTKSCIPRDGDRHSLPPRQQNIRENIPRAAQSEQSDDSPLHRGHDVHTAYADIHVTEDMHMNSQESMHRRHDSSPINTRHKPNHKAFMNALREEIKDTISATIKEKLRSDADSVTTVSQSILALDANAQYWSNLSNNAARRSHRALELQLKLAEEKVNTLLHKEAPEEALLEAAREV